MIALCQSGAESYAETYIHKTIPVLLETSYEDGTIDGHTDTYLSVRVRTDKQSGDVIPVRILGRKGDELYGEEIL